MKLLDLSSDVLRQIMIYYIDNSKLNQKKIKFIGSKGLNGINETINIKKPRIYDVCWNPNEEVSELISEEDTNYVDDYGDTFLMISCRNNIMKYICKILKFECKLWQVNETGNTALMYACRHKQTEVALKILEMDYKGTVAGKPEQYDEYGCTALILACANKMSDVALKLVNMGNICNPNKVNRMGYTSLMIACKHKITEVALKLLDMDCNLNQMDHHERTALSYAMENGMQEVIEKIGRMK